MLNLSRFFLRTFAKRLVAFFLSFLWIHPAFAAESIRSFDVQATLSADRRLTVNESIDYDFDDAFRHGIFRDLPDTYERNGGIYRLNCTVDGVTMDGKAVTWETSRVSDGIQVKIGDPNSTITGHHLYTIRYRTDRAVNDFADGHELYWNVTGNGWMVDIATTTFSLVGPAASTRSKCYTGSLGSVAEDCTVKTDGKNVTFATKNSLSYGEGLTVVAAFPVDSIRVLTVSDVVLQFLSDNLIAFLPVLVFLLMFVIWWKFGREPRGRGTVIPQYEEPRKLRPAMMAGLMEQKVSQAALTATILDLGRRGFLSVKFIGDPSENGRFKQKTTYHFVKGQNLPEESPEFERKVYNGLFDGRTEVALAELKGTFWKSAEEARAKVFEALRTQGLFGMNPMTVRALWIFLAGTVFFLGFMIGQQFVDYFAAFASGFIILIFGWQMPRMTPEGAVVREECEGFKRFLSVTEKVRLDFTDAPERTPEQFARFLPAAVAFGVESKWAGQFAGIELEPPSYFQGTMIGWNAMMFANAIGGLQEASASTIYQAPASQAGSGGSGFGGGGSGGGFGGGGGGSW